MRYAWIVEHHPDVAANIARILQDLNFSAIMMTQERGPLSLVDETWPEVIMLGPDLPDGHGLNVLACLNKFPQRTKTKIVFYATESDTRSTEIARQLRADAVLQTKRLDRAMVEKAFRETGLIQ
jgi:DNA-binding response OmpR family regulator